MNSKNNNYHIPFITEQNKYGERLYDIYSKLLKERIIFLTGQINDILSNSIIAQMLLLESKDDKKDISIYINSHGGLVSSGMAIYDTIQFIKPNVNTICIGCAYSMAALILSSGKKGKRYCLKNSKIMIHQPLGKFFGQASDIEIQTKEILKTKKMINNILSKHTGINIKKIEKDTERDFFLSSEESLKYGLIDIIL